MLFDLADRPPPFQKSFKPLAVLRVQRRLVHHEVYLVPFDAFSATAPGSTSFVIVTVTRTRGRPGRPTGRQQTDGFRENIDHRRGVATAMLIAGRADAQAARAGLENAEGKTVGTATLEQQGNDGRIVATFTALPVIRRR